jgi:hypothetical protein
MSKSDQIGMNSTKPEYLRRVNIIQSKSEYMKYVSINQFKPEKIIKICV